MNAFGFTRRSSACMIPASSAGVSGRQGRVGSYGEEANFGATVSHRWRRAKLMSSIGAPTGNTPTPARLTAWTSFCQLTYSRALSATPHFGSEDHAGQYDARQRRIHLRPALNAGSARSACQRVIRQPHKLFAVARGSDLAKNRRGYHSISAATDSWSEGQSLLLAGLNGYSARASVAYRLTPRQTISASYNNTYFDYQRAFGDSRLQIAALGYSIGFTRQWDLEHAGRRRPRGYARPDRGSARSSDRRADRPKLRDGDIRTRVYLPVAEARLVRRFKSRSLTFDYAKGVTPGNGYYLTSRQTSAAVALFLHAGEELGAARATRLTMSSPRWDRLSASTRICREAFRCSTS